jgi:hypothetical protein
MNPLLLKCSNHLLPRRRLNAALLARKVAACSACTCCSCLAAHSATRLTVGLLIAWCSTARDSHKKIGSLVGLVHAAVVLTCHVVHASTVSISPVCIKLSMPATSCDACNQLRPPSRCPSSSITCQAVFFGLLLLRCCCSVPGGCSCAASG